MKNLNISFAQNFQECKLALNLIYKIFGINEWSPKMVNCLLEGISCLLIYLLAMRIFKDVKIALISALIYSCYFISIYIKKKKVLATMYFIQ